MRFSMFLGAVGFGAAAKSWIQTHNATAHAHTGLEHRESIHQFKSEAKRAHIFDHHYKPFVLGEVINLSEDSAIFRFLLHRQEDVFDLVPCSTLQACFKEGMNTVDQPMRFYTPITPNGTKGYFDLIVRKYPKGRFTEHLFSMEVGETLLFRSIQYKMQYKSNKWRHVGLIGGGTGITSLLQVMRASFQDPEDRTNISLLFANRSESKILLRGMLDAFAVQFADRFKVHYTVDKAEDPEKWKGFTGHITLDMVRKTMPPPAEDVKMLVCGPDRMMQQVVGAKMGVMKAMSGGLAQQPVAANLNNIQDVQGFLGDLGYTKEMVYRF